MHRLFLIPVVLMVGLPPTATRADKKSKPAPTDSFNDPVKPFRPRDARSEAETDRVRSDAYFAQGRLLFQRRDMAGALRAYQRAYRYNPDATDLLGDIVSISFRLNRQSEAYRYAAIAAETSSQRSQLVLGMAGYVAEQRQTRRAIKIYKRGLKLMKPTEIAQQLSVRLEIGRLSFLARQYKESARQFDVILKVLKDKSKVSSADRNKLMPRPARTYTMFGLGYLLAKRTKEAEEMFRRVDKHDPSPGRLAYHLARVAFVKKDYKTTRKWLDEYLQLKSVVSGNSPYQLLEQVLQATHKDKNAANAEYLKVLEKAHAEQPKNHNLTLLLAAEQLESEKLKPAAKLFNQLLKTNLATTAREGLIQVATKQKNVPLLLDELARSIKSDKGFQSLTSSGRALAGDKDKKLARGIIQLATSRLQNKQNDEHAQLWSPLAAGLLALEIDQLDAAQKLLRHALKHKKAKRAEILISWGLSLTTKKHAQRAVPLLRQVIDEKLRKKDHPSIMLQLATAYQLAGKRDAALAMAKKAITLQPKSIALRVDYAGVLFRMRALAEAEREYLRVLKRHDKDYRSTQTRALVRQARLVLSTICVMTNRPDPAEEWLEEVLDEFPEHVGAANDLGYLWCDRGTHLQRALKMVRYAVQAEPANAAYRDSLGWVWYRLKKYKLAVKELKQAVKLAGPNPDGVILDHLGDAYLKDGDKGNAQATYKKALKAFTENEKDKKAATRRKIKKLESK